MKIKVLATWPCWLYYHGKKKPGPPPQSEKCSAVTPYNLPTTPLDVSRGYIDIQNMKLMFLPKPTQP